MQTIRNGTERKENGSNSKKWAQSCQFYGDTLETEHCELFVCLAYTQRWEFAKCCQQYSLIASLQQQVETPAAVKPALYRDL